MRKGWGGNTVVLAKGVIHYTSVKMDQIDRLRQCHSGCRIASVLPMSNQASYKPCLLTPQADCHIPGGYLMPSLTFFTLRVLRNRQKARKQPFKGLALFTSQKLWAEWLRRPPFRYFLYFSGKQTIMGRIKSEMRRVESISERPFLAFTSRKKKGNKREEKNQQFL